MPAKLCNWTILQGHISAKMTHLGQRDAGSRFYAADGQGIHSLCNHAMLVCLPHTKGVLQGQLVFVSWLPCDQRLKISQLNYFSRVSQAMSPKLHPHIALARQLKGYYTDIAIVPNRTKRNSLNSILWRIDLAMLLHRSIHRPFHSPDLPNNSSDFNSDNPFAPRESPMTDSGSQTIMPALLVNRASAPSDHSHDVLQQFPCQGYISPESSFTWPKLEQSETFGHTSLGYRTEPSSSAIHSRTCFGDVEDQAKGDDKWRIGPHQQLPTPFSSLSSSFNNSSFETDQALAPSTQSNSAIRPPILPTRNHQSQLRPWTDFTTANGFEETGARPRYNPPQAYAYDTAPSLDSSLYATSSDLRTPTQPKLHRPFRETERSAPLDSESESEGKQGEPPYAKLIYRALMDAPEHQMVLKDIYEWIAQNTDKARDPAFKGWQNSVRHNLSMNGVSSANRMAHLFRRH